MSIPTVTSTPIPPAPQAPTAHLHLPPPPVPPSPSPPSPPSSDSAPPPPFPSIGTRLGARHRLTLQESRSLEKIAQLQHEVDAFRTGRALDFLRIARLTEEGPTAQRAIDSERAKSAELQERLERSEALGAKLAEKLKEKEGEVTELKGRVEEEVGRERERAEAFTQRQAKVAEEGAAQRVVIDRLLRVKASRDQRILGLLEERSRLAQLLAKTRVEEKEEEDRRTSGDWALRRLSLSGKRMSAGEDGGGAEGRTALLALTPNSQQRPRPSYPLARGSAGKGRALGGLTTPKPRPMTSPAGGGVEDGGVEREEVGPGVSLSLLLEEAALSRLTNERLRKQIALLEEKCQEWEKVSPTRHLTAIALSHCPSTHTHCTCHTASSVLMWLCLLLRCAVLCCAMLCCVMLVVGVKVGGALSGDNRDLMLRFKHSCDARRRVERKLKAVEEALAQAHVARPAESHLGGWAR